MGLLALVQGQELLSVTSNGFGKRTPEAEYPCKGRGGKGMIAHKTSKRTGTLVSLHQVVGDENIVLISSEGKFIRTIVSSIAQLGRSTQGVTVMKTDGMDVGAVAVVRAGAVELDLEPEPEPPNRSRAEAGGAEAWQRALASSAGARS